MDAWNRADQALDADDTGTLLQMMGALKFHLKGVPGVKPVGKGLKGKKDLKAAVAAHRSNGDVYKAGQTIEFRDDYSRQFGARIEEISPYFHARAIEASGAAVYSYTGWYDGSYTAPSVYRYMNLSNRRKLIIGPWPHGGRENISPWRDSAKNSFDHNAELLRFFDYHLKGIDNGIMDEPPVWYYTMGEEKWHSAPSWPPASTPVDFYFGEGFSLVRAAPGAGGRDAYHVDYTAGTGNASRHNSLLNLEEAPIGYPDRAAADRKLLVYQSAPLDADLEVTGHPVVRLFVSSTADDGEFFVYLEDVGPDGTVSYITEGLLRAACRKVSDDQRLYQTPPNVPWHSFERADAEPLVPGEVALITFGLQPTSVLFRRDHRIRVAIAGADKDHYAVPPGPEPQITVYRGAQYPSAIELPVVTGNENE